MDAQAELQAIYAELPKVECQRKCWGSCGPIYMQEIEADRIKAASGRDPKHSLKLGETMDLEKGFLCSFLTKDHACSVYEQRPLICRVWGAAEGLECEWGCKPERLLTPNEVSDYIGRIIAVSPKRISTATRQQLDMMHRLQDDLNTLPRCACGKLAFALLGEPGEEVPLCREHGLPLLAGRPNFENVRWSKMPEKP